MDPSDTQVTGAPAPLILNGKEFKASPLSDLDHGELDLWCQSQVIAMARASASDLSKAERDEVIEAAITVATKIRWLSPQGAPFFRSIKGVARLALQMLLKHHPKLTHQQVISLMEDPVDVENVHTVFKFLHRIPGSENGEDGEKRGSGGNEESR